ncbi:LpxI family protein [Mesorhizobium sp. IMUNJ 23232]|uniref:LpxI family protein n=1 Tax=Mesorhizobium sp. IMUNJ 23232 TaxID=3376064 RepID=UPI0037A2F3F2
MTTPTTRTSRPLVELGPADKVAVVAGSGRLPVNIAESLAMHGHPPLVLRVRGEADNGAAFAAFETDEIGLGEFAEMAPRLRRRGVTHVVLAGGISRRPAWREIRPSFSLFRHLAKVLTALARGDDGLLRILVKGIESEGFRVVGAHEIVPDLLAAEGPMTRAKPLKSDRADLDAAYAAARTIGALDIGQGTVSIGGRVIAVEGVEGTDGMLQRVRDLRGHGRLAGKTRGVLVKCAKPGQELRADLPSIGPMTVEAAHAAGLAGIGVEAGRSLVLDSTELVARADALGLFVIGLPQGGPA